MNRYAVPTCSTLLKIISLFCKRALWKRRYSAKETYNFKEPTNRSHHICIISECRVCFLTCSRLLKIIGLFCNRALRKRQYSAKETYNFKEPTNRRHPICTISECRVYFLTCSHVHTFWHPASISLTRMTYVSSLLDKLSYVYILAPWHTWKLSYIYILTPWAWQTLIRIYSDILIYLKALIHIYSDTLSLSSSHTYIFWLPDIRCHMYVFWHPQMVDTMEAAVAYIS